MLWNELEYDTQSTILLKILSLIDDERDKKMRGALMAAFLELRMWSNFPCQVIEEESLPVAEAQDQYEDC
jgi:hypothetical protein